MLAHFEIYHFNPDECHFCQNDGARESQIKVQTPFLKIINKFGLKFSNAFILSFYLKRDYRKLHRNIHSFHNCSLSVCGEYHEIHFQLDREYQ